MPAKENNRFFILVLCCLLSVLIGCTKVAPLYTLKTPQNAPDTTRDVRKILDSIPDLSLFALACQRAAIFSQLDPAVFYTLYTPTDSAMKAAGLTADVINGLPPDSLAVLVKYHITFGGVSDSTLTNATISIQQNCLLESLYFSPAATPTAGYSTYRHSIFVKNYDGLLNIDGWAVNAGEHAIAASNGYLYPIHFVLHPPMQTLWELVNLRPELSYYRAAINIMDSLYIPLNNGRYFQMSDSVLFSQLRFEQVPGAQPVYPSPVRPTVFAPTNTAFVQAGFSDIASLRDYIMGSIRVDTIYPDPVNNPGSYFLNNVPGDGYQLLPNGGLSSVFNFFPLDSALKMQYLFNNNQHLGSYGIPPDQSTANALCYSDLTGSASVNNGVLNITTLNADNPSSITPYTLHFSSGAGGLLHIRWNPANTGEAIISKDENQQQQQRNFWGLNGVIYESDRLFFNK